MCGANQDRFFMAIETLWVRVIKEGFLEEEVEFARVDGGTELSHVTWCTCSVYWGRFRNGGGITSC